ncbi:MAG TPA: molecular chaperone [Scandinavium sp.]|uniref:fimbrial biogenesis chaperone n=1 Tax=Scandinavium sp. TaxID=2830653 RepID=UPI002E325499|nr:molecular chaperone [Scandinavium sp.]HEX4501799.1 molecular chaperone [Scandinavium sp.]
MKLIKTVLLTSLAMIWSASSVASIHLSANRIIYKEAKGEAVLTAKNEEKRNYLVQSWLDAAGNPEITTKQLPFVVTPPLFQLVSGSESIIQVVYQGTGLPADKESLLWLNVRGVPSLTEQEQNLKNKLSVAVTERIKVIFRPKSLADESASAIGKIEWQRGSNGMVHVVNNSPYYVILNKIDINNVEVKVSAESNNTVISPKGTKDYPIESKAGGLKIIWSGVTDFGVKSKEYSVTL